MDWAQSVIAALGEAISWMNWASASIVFATLLGPILAVQIQKLLERKRSISERRHAIFRTLMATRAAMLSGEHVQAFNAVPIEFYGSRGRLKRINLAWKAYLQHHSPDLPKDEEWEQTRLNLFADMMHQIARFLGFDFSQEQIQNEFYGPQAHGVLENEQTIIRHGLVNLLSGERPLQMAVKEFPSDPQVLENQEAIQRLLQEWLKGERAVTVRQE